MVLSLVGTNCGSPDANWYDAVADAYKTHRTFHRISANINAIRVVYAGSALSVAGGDLSGPNSFTVKVGVERITLANASTIMDMGGVITPVSFGGTSTGTVNPGAILESDLVPFTANAGDIVMIRAYIVPVGGNLLPGDGKLMGLTSGNGLGLGEAFSLADVSYGGALTVTNDALVTRPIAILGQTVDGTTAPSVAIIGDSISAGTGDLGVFEMQYNGGFLVRACWQQDVPQIDPFGPTVPVGYINLSRGGEQISQWVNFATNTIKPKLSLYATDAWSFMWGNDTDANAIKTNLVTLANWYTSRGKTFRATTHTPGSPSTDGWRTIANQTPTNVTIVAPVHTFLRDTTSSGFVQTCASPAKVFVSELTAIVSVDAAGNPTPDATFWHPMGPVIASGTATSGQANWYLEDTTKAWAPQSLRGYTLYIVGGLGAGTFAQIEWNSAIRVTTNALSVDATSVYEIRGSYTLDGAHPATIAHQALAKGFSPSMLTSGSTTTPADPYRSDNATPVTILADYKPGAPNPFAGTGLVTFLLPTVVLTWINPANLLGGTIHILRMNAGTSDPFVVVGTVAGTDANTAPAQTYTDITVLNGHRYTYTAFATPYGDTTTP